MPIPYKQIPLQERDMASPDIGSGNARGLMDFMDFMVAKGYGRAGAIDPWKSAAKQVFSTVEGEGFEEADVRSFDIDEYLSRFENMSLGKYSAQSLRAYRGRFRKAVEAYRSYLADPNWKPTLRRSARSTADNDSAKEPSKHASKKQPETSPKAPAAPPIPGSLIAYPFPLKSGQMAQLHLPTQGLDREDADRLTHFIRALVFEQPAQLNSGEQDEDA
jgi:hypothetical protein